MTVHSLSYTASTMGVRIWREITSEPTRTVEVEYHYCSRMLNILAYLSWRIWSIGKLWVRVIATKSEPSLHGEKEGAFYIPPVLPVWATLLVGLLNSFLNNSSTRTCGLQVTEGQIYETLLRYLQYTYRRISLHNCPYQTLSIKFAVFRDEHCVVWYITMEVSNKSTAYFCSSPLLHSAQSFETSTTTRLHGITSRNTVTFTVLAAIKPKLANSNKETGCLWIVPSHRSNLHNTFLPLHTFIVGEMCHVWCVRATPNWNLQLHL
jgi:hypothetical protein